MFYKLKEDVFLIEGALNAAVYDLNNEGIHSINKVTNDAIKEILRRDLSLEVIPQKIVELVQDLESARIIEPCTTFSEMKSILSLKQPYFIKSAWIEIGRKCNFFCKHCYNKKENSKIELSYDEILEICNKLHVLNVKKIQFIGGEPLLYFDKLKKVINRVRNYFNDISVFTNGYLINEERIQFFKKNKITLKISMYNQSDFQDDYHINNYDLIMEEKINLCQLYNLNYTVYGICNQDNIGEYDDNIRFDFPRLTGNSTINLYNLEMFRKKAITLNKFKKRITKNTIVRNVSGHNCFSSKLYIDSMKDIYPCVMERRIKHSNVLESKDLMLLDTILSYTKDNIKVCKDCEYRYACFDCRPDSLRGEINEKPWFCTYNPYTGVWEDPDLHFSRVKSTL